MGCPFFSCWDVHAVVIEMCGLGSSVLWGLHPGHLGLCLPLYSGRCGCSFSPSLPSIFVDRHTHSEHNKIVCLCIYVFFFFYFLSGAVCFLYVFFLTGAAVGDILSFSTCALSFYCQCFTEISFPLSLKGSYNCWVFSLYYCRVFIVQYTILILMRLLLWFGTTSINLN